MVQYRWDQEPESTSELFLDFQLVNWACQEIMRKSQTHVGESTIETVHDKFNNFVKIKLVFSQTRRKGMRG
jgi:hypothetical protein